MKLLIFVTVLTLLGSTTLAASGPQPIVIPANAIPWSARSGSEFALLEGSMQGSGPYAFRIKFTAHGESDPEYHSSVDHIVVLAGRFSIGFGTRFDRKHMRALPAGSFIAVPRHTAHYTTADPGTIVQVYGFGPRITTNMQGRPK
jgi:hypothetical protein